MRRVAQGAVLACVVLSLLAVQVRSAEDAQKFLRFVDDNDGGGKLETAIVTYKNAQGRTVHLVSAVHVGETKYYQGLNKTFEGYDALLYELIKPKDGAAPRPNAPSMTMIGMFQRLLKDVLELDFQLDAVNYRAANFVHADLDAETFAQKQAERGESLLTLMLRQMLAEMSRPLAEQMVPDVGFPELMVALTSPDRARHFKMILARQFENLEKRMAGLDGPDGSVLVTERNKAAIRVLEQTLAGGKKNVGIFYGAAHMKDLEQRLLALGFQRVGVEWRVAWDMTPREGDVVIRRVKKAAEPAQN